MQAHALRPYERSLVSGRPLGIEHGGVVQVLDVLRWLDDADATDRAVLETISGPVLDVGCGPGRIGAALAERGVLCLGIDIAPAAVRLTRARGVPALHRSVFDRVPGEPRWRTGLLLDGNIGIGGDPGALLRRMRQIIAPDGSILVETAQNPAADERFLARFHTNGRAVGPPFAWAHIGASVLAGLAENNGLTVRESWRLGDREFTTLKRRRTSPAEIGR